ncbi:S-layer homology domain-containing protein [Oscillibacter hominis]|uniref:S-layer homology domain-containing protein n=1 Tax=Oscillibacter hominis TaxID=2763056 RepID=A0A7G9B3H8_9FIRM|nr:S-layer homology domain-containing protein [Oscillibacter hominis]QNL44109.1 S-layer homology domain-containing protein [Oscillibacter hominis]
MKKRILSLALTLALTVSALSVSAAGAVRFGDVPDGSWAEESIARAVEAGILSGYDSARFGYGHRMSRAAFATALVRLFGWTEVRPAAPTFSDVKDTAAWYYGSVEAAYAHGAITLQSERFRPGDPITREEMAVMIVRALDYEALAGLVQQLPSPFTDLTTNSGYIAVAYNLGLVNGTSPTTFSPSQKATREQAAVLLMRVYDKYHLNTTFVGGLASQETKALPVRMNAVAVEMARLEGIDATFEGDPAVRDLVRGTGAKALMYAACGKEVVEEDTMSGMQAVAWTLADNMELFGYDGILLDVPGLTSAGKEKLVKLAEEIKGRMTKGKLLYVMVDAPAWNDEAPGGYDYEALGKTADRMILRVASYEQTESGFPIAPLEPLEELYYALAGLQGKVPAWKTTVLLTTTGSAWKGEGDQIRPDGSRTAAQIEELLKYGNGYHAGRYASAYAVSGTGAGQTTVWYNDEDAVSARLQLARFFGVTSVMLSDVNSVADYSGYDVAGQLWS